MEKRLSIQQMVIATGLSAHTLRYYERIGLIQPGRDHSSCKSQHYHGENPTIILVNKLFRIACPPG